MYHAFRFMMVGLLACCWGIAPAMAQTMPVDPVQTTPVDQVAARTAACREITAQVPIDGQPQTVSGLACLQSDGIWHLVPSDYPPPEYTYEWYDDPWYWGPGVGFGAGFFFVDSGFHHHHFRHGFAHPANDGVGFHGGMGGFRGGGHHR